MRRLTRRAARPTRPAAAARPVADRPVGSRHPLRRLREERGGVAVFVACLMPILFALAAIAIDTAAIWSARQQTQTGADAAVIAVALDCARGSCGSAAHMRATAEEGYWSNNEAAKAGNLGPGEGWISASSSNGGRTGRVSATQKTDWVIDHFFASALGYDTGTLSVDSHAGWAPAASGRADVPLGISWCTYRAAVGGGTPGPGTPATLQVTTGITGSCTGPSGGTVPGGTALTVADSSCRSRSDVGQSVRVHRGGYNGGLAAGCTASNLSRLVGADIVVPVWDAVAGQTGPNPTFRVHGYAAFRVTGYSPSGPALHGHFTRAARQIDATTPPPTTAPDLGARVVFLDHT